MLVQFAQMGSAYASARYHSDSPTVALLSIGEEPTKGNALVKETHAAARRAARDQFRRQRRGPRPAAGDRRRGGHRRLHRKRRVEGARGGPQVLHGRTLEVFSIDEETKRASEVLLPHLAPLAEDLDPDGTGGAVLLGVEGVCVISHGSSNARAIVSAVRVAHEAGRRRTWSDAPRHGSRSGHAPGHARGRDRA